MWHWLRWHWLQVRCRKPEELAAGLTEEDVRKLEQQEFQSHPELREVRPTLACTLGSCLSV